MTNACIVGVDPGLGGGMAALMPDGNLLYSTMPVVAIGKRHELDEVVIRSWLCEIGPAHVFIEKVHSMPRQGVVSCFTFGLGVGLVRGICCGLQVPYELVTPQAWQKVMLDGYAKGSEYLVASRLWPGKEFKMTERCKKAHTGLVDASLIAEYGRRRLAACGGGG